MFDVHNFRFISMQQWLSLTCLFPSITFIMRAGQKQSLNLLGNYRLTLGVDRSEWIVTCASQRLIAI